MDRRSGCIPLRPTHEAQFSGFGTEKGLHDICHFRIIEDNAKQLSTIFERSTTRSFSLIGKREYSFIQNKIMGLFDFLKPQSSQQKRQAELLQKIQATMPVIFPGGKAETEEWSRRVYDSVDGRLTMQECVFIFGAISALFAMSEDKSESRMVEGILHRANGKISREDARRIFMVICAHQQAG